MSDIVIQVENLSKQYRLGEVSTGTISHDLNRWWCRLRGKEDPYLKVTQANVREQKAEKLKNGNAEIEQEEDKEQKAEKLKEENQGGSTINNEHSKSPLSAFQRFSLSAFSSKLSASQHFSVSDSSSDYVWALKDIDFEVKRGEVLGIIGRNGAGKSTLLKILSRITAPTTGEVRVKGRIASLLEVGTGFHPELTGRENIFLNGAILGMTKAEIRGKLDEIVDFSGCARYLDTPVKRYSSGMMVRLGFAVAAHLEPEILIVDEVLAVGDAEFQKKCIGKMQDVAKGGRTVLFVSHNMAAVSKLCNSACLIAAGELQHRGETAQAIQLYLSSHGSLSTTWTSQKRKTTLVAQIQRVSISQKTNCPESFVNEYPINVRVWFEVKQQIDHSQIALELVDSLDHCIFASSTSDSAMKKQRFQPGKFLASTQIPTTYLREGEYSMNFAITTPKFAIHDHVAQAVRFRLTDPRNLIHNLGEGRRGSILPVLEWNVFLQQDL